MENNRKICPMCGSSQTMQGKLHGTASLQSLDARTGLGGSELIFTFCKDCGEVLGIKVKSPGSAR